MNEAARFVLYVLGGVLLLCVGRCMFPNPPEVISKNLDALIVAFVAVLARTGSDKPQENP